MGGGGMGGMEEMMAGMNIPKNSRVDANAMERRAKYQTISGRLKSKLDEKRKSAEVESIENGYSIEKTSDKNDFVFKLKDGEAQPKTSLKQPAAAAAPKEEAWLEELIADQSSIVGNTAQKPKETKKRRRTRTRNNSQTNYIYLPLIYNI
jgi:hypothetical protein